MIDPQDSRPAQAAVAVIFKASKLLVIRRSKTVRAPGLYCLPGGGIEQGESPREAIVREMREEINARAQPIRDVWRSFSPWGVELHWWLTELIDRPEPNPVEVESIHWMQVDELLARNDRLASVDGFLEAICAGKVDLTELL